jgi:hypothetical protein
MFHTFFLQAILTPTYINSELKYPMLLKSAKALFKISSDLVSIEAAIIILQSPADNDG